MSRKTENDFPIFLDDEITKKVNSLSMPDVKALAILLDEKEITHRSDIYTIFFNLIRKGAYTQEEILDILVDKYDYK